MSILIRIVEFFRKTKIKNREKIFKDLQATIRQLDLDQNGTNGAINTLASACNYDTFYFTLLRILSAIKFKIKTEKDPKVIKYYKNNQIFFGFLKFLLDYYGGYLGFLWL